MIYLKDFLRSGDNVRITFDDIIFFIGLGLTTTGLWMYSPSVSLTVTGGFLMLIGFARAGGDK